MFMLLFLLFSCSVMSDSLWFLGLQHARLPCPSPSPRVCSNSYPLSWWCHPTISSSVAHFSSCPHFPPAPVFSNEIPLWHQVAKVLELQLQHQSFQWIFWTDFLKIDWLDLLAVQGTLKSLLQHHSSKASVLQCLTFLWSNSRICIWLLEKSQLWLYGLWQQSNVPAFAYAV